MNNTAGTPPPFDPYRRIPSVLAGSAHYDDLGDPVGARNPVVARQAALRYSLTRPPQRVAGTIRSCCPLAFGGGLVIGGARGPVEDLIEAQRDQLWAEARDKWEDGVPEFANARLPRSLLDDAAAINDQYRRSDTSLEDAIDSKLDGWEERTLVEIAKFIGLHEGDGPLDRGVQDRLARGLKARGWEKKQRKKDGKRSFVWSLPGATELDF